MSNCTNVCGIRSKALQLEQDKWFQVKRPSGKIILIRLDVTGLYLMRLPEETEAETFDSLVELKKRLREFP